jgi:hypothetical protein
VVVFVGVLVFVRVRTSACEWFEFALFVEFGYVVGGVAFCFEYGYACVLEAHEAAGSHAVHDEDVGFEGEEVFVWVAGSADVLAAVDFAFGADDGAVVV